MAERVKIYEEKKRGLPMWAWLLPLLLVLALLAYFFSRHRGESERSGETPTVSQTSPAAFPDPGTVHFEADQATLTPEGEATLQRAARAMEGNPNVHLRLEGYADSTGDAAHNESLSDRRTKTVADYLQSQGIDRSRLTGAGFGAERPSIPTPPPPARQKIAASNFSRSNNQMSRPFGLLQETPYVEDSGRTFQQHSGSAAGEAGSGVERL